MRGTPWRSTVILVAALGLAAPAADDDFHPLTRGDDPAQFQLVGFGPDTISIKGGEIRLTGKPNGYFATKHAYGDYTLSFEWMYEKPDGYQPGDTFSGNSGLLVHIEGEHKVWPKCIEVQLANSDAGNTFAINKAQFRGRKDAEAQKKAIKPVGEWNREVVVCEGDRITCTINGVEVCEGAGAVPQRGPIGWQSEGSPIRFRNLKIKTKD